jgi:transposase-like protein
MKKRVFYQAFKRESASLVVDKGYSIKAACTAVGVSEVLCANGLGNYERSMAARRPLAVKR